MLNYKRFLAAPALRSFIQCYWIIQASDLSQELDLISDGHPELIFLQRPGMQMKVGGQVYESVPLAGLVGQLSKRTFTYYQAGDRVVFVKLYPWDTLSLFSSPL